MPQKERDRYLWDTFCEFWPPWKEHVEDWDHYADDTIIVRMAKDGYVTSGKKYLFGDRGCDSWHLEMIKA